MVNLTKTLSAGLEDYIETIYISNLENKPPKGVELARMLNVSRASVSEALTKLASKGLIEYKSYGTINLTPKGISEAEKIYKTHTILKTFFENVLDIDSKEASENACKIEHIISNNIIEKIKTFSEFCQNNPNILNKYKEERI